MKHPVQMFLIFATLFISFTVVSTFLLEVLYIFVLLNVIYINSDTQIKEIAMLNRLIYFLRFLDTHELQNAHFISAPYTEKNDATLIRRYF